MKFKLTLFIAASLLHLSLSAQQASIIPQPQSLKYPDKSGTFVLDASTQIVLEGSSTDKAVDFFNEYLKKYYGFHLSIASKSSSKNAIRLNYERMDKYKPGAYNLSVDSKGVYITGDNEDGVFYGIQTLIQLLPLPDLNKKSIIKKLGIPFLVIEDEPRFAYRGLHLDVGRHFMPVDFVKKYIDYIALHKLNFFHWHLTEDQGWRIEIKKYPKLTTVGAWRNGTIIGRYPGTGNDGIRYGGFYTQAEIKDVVSYAQKRYITVVPEIEMPGHSSAAIAAYPELSCFPDKTTEYPAMCAWSGSREGKQVQQTWGVFDDVFCAGKENTFQFLQDVLDEVLALFPSQYIHVGGDECPKEHWKKCPNCQKRMKENNLKDEHQLQSYFIQRMEKYLNSKGRILIGWDEILEGGLAPNAVVMSWRGEKGGIEAANQKHKVIMSPQNPVYFDHTQSESEDSVTIGGFNPIEKVYAYDPIPKELNEEQSGYIMGAQANVWTEYMKNTKKVEYMLFPRISALSEVLWSQVKEKNWINFEDKMKTQYKRYETWKANYSKAYFDIKISVLPSVDYSGVLVKADIKGKENEIYFSGNKTSLPGTKYSAPISLSKSQDLNLSVKSNGKLISTTTKTFRFNKATGKEIKLTREASKTYPGDGAFTLVNGIVNEKGFARSKEFIGFSGEDCEAIIDLGKSTPVMNIVVHFLNRPSSWIYRPSAIEVFRSVDGKEWHSLKISDDIENKQGSEKASMKLEFEKANARYIKLNIANWGEIPQGNPGAGKKSWLFLDEIEIN